MVVSSGSESWYEGPPKDPEALHYVLERPYEPSGAWIGLEAPAGPGKRPVVERARRLSLLSRAVRARRLHVEALGAGRLRVKQLLLDDCGRLGLPRGLWDSVCTRAWSIIERFAEVRPHTAVGQHKDYIVAASLWIALSEAGYTLTPKEYGEHLGVEWARVKGWIWDLIRDTGLEVSPASPRRRVKDHITRIASSLGVETAIQLAWRIAEEAIEAGCGSYTPSLAAASLYIATAIEGVKKPLEKIAAKAGVGVASARKKRRRLDQKVDIEVYI
jgi:transcription initiation factor TFIIIB Brf1 subunit/transcription initiation factor TFIIB